MTVAVCPGSFDPVTFGHLDVIKKVSDLFNKVYVLVAVNYIKKPLFTSNQRVDLLKKSIELLELKNVEVLADDGLIVDFIKDKQANVIVKGLRQGSDYENEIGMALLNRKLGNVETLFLPAAAEHLHISSSYVKDVALHGGDISSMVPEVVSQQISQILESKSKTSQSGN